MIWSVALSVVLVWLNLFSAISSDQQEKLMLLAGGEASFGVVQQLKLPAQPVNVSSDRLQLRAKAALALDPDSGQILFEQNANQVLPIASIAKLATAAIIVKEHRLDQTITVPELPSYPSAAVRIGLVPGQRFKIEDLLKATLIHSANDAADALAIHNAGSLGAFVAKLGDQTRYWGIEDITLADASGLSSSSQASPAALAALASLALASQDILRLAAIETATISDDSGLTYRLETTNQLLKEAGFLGLKTGYTGASGESVVTLAEREGARVLTIVLGSPDRFGETRQLVEYVYRTWSWQ